MHMEPSHVRSRAVLSLIACLVLACESGERTQVVTTGKSTGTAEIPAPASKCAGLDDGASCGESYVCIAERCVAEQCGDGQRSVNEACDDGNFASADGCSPSCNLEFLHCDSGDWVPYGVGCTSDAGTTGGGEPAASSASCSKVAIITAPDEVPREPLRGLINYYVLAGETVTLTAGGARLRVMKGGMVWRARRNNGPWSADRLGTPSERSTTFKCPEEDADFEIATMTEASGCAPSSVSISLSCTTKPRQVDPGTGAPDGGMAGPSPLDAGVLDAGVLDAGMLDASVLDAGVRDAGTTDGGSSPGASRFRRPACEECVRRVCSNYYETNLAGPCFEGTGFDATFARECSAVFFCSHNALDGCGDQVAAGPVGCFCGMDVTVEECQASAANVKGRCKDEWYAATRCAAGAHTCALDKFSQLDVPSGYAFNMFLCQNEYCRDECAP